MPFRSVGELDAEEMAFCSAIRPSPRPQGYRSLKNLAVHNETFHEKFDPLFDFFENSLFPFRSSPGYIEVLSVALFYASLFELW